MQAIYRDRQGVRNYLHTILNRKNTVWWDFYNDNSDKRHILEVHVEYLTELHNSYNDLAFLPERIKTCQKLVCNLCDQKKYVV